MWSARLTTSTALPITGATPTSTRTAATTRRVWVTARSGERTSGRLMCVTITTASSGLATLAQRRMRTKLRPLGAPPLRREIRSVHPPWSSCTGFMGTALWRPKGATAWTQAWLFRRPGRSSNWLCTAMRLTTSFPAEAITTITTSRAHPLRAPPCRAANGSPVSGYMAHWTKSTRVMRRERTPEII